MCGISAIIAWGDGRDVPGALLRMHAQIPHRGPDGERFVCVDAHYRVLEVSDVAGVRALAPDLPWRLGLGFRWLQIQDRSSAAAQPMGAGDGAVWLLFNGEIYNFRELRAELQGYGVHFQTQSDTEVVLAAYQQWGPACFHRFCGMWAMVLVDVRARKVTLSRDRFGMKPLFYWSDGQQLRLASEIKQLLAASSTPIPVNLTLAWKFLRGVDLHHGEETFFTEIRAVPPATYAEIDLAAPAPPSLQFQPYWQLPDAAAASASPPLRFPEACARLDALLRTSVAAHRVAQAPLGCLLSGGLDSSTLAALLSQGARRCEDPLPSFSLGMAAYAELDESPYIDAVTRHLQLGNVKTTLDAAWLQQHMQRISWTQEEPLIGPAWVAQYRLYQLAADHGMRVILDGQGADEFLAGYPRYQYILWQDWLAQRRWGALGRELAWLGATQPAALFNAARRGVQALRRRWCHTAEAPQGYAWLGHSEAIGYDPCAAAGALARPVSASRSRLDQVLAYDVQHGNLKTVLAIGDRNSMAHAIESRVPYLDHRVVEFAFQMPEQYKVGHGLRKRLLRQVAAQYLPAQVVYRRDRIGFGLPVNAWLREELREPLLALPSTALVRHSPLFDAPRLAVFLDAFETRQRRDAAVLWRLYALWQWAEAYQLTLG